jgi:hypothetical protein
LRFANSAVPIAVIDGFDVQLSDERSPRGSVRVIRLFPLED